MGVLNRTPNSFSDHGLSLNPQYFESQLNTFLNDETVIVDVGFESTAPMNEAITFEEELNRFRDFLEASKKFSFEERFISFDTYKPQNFLIMEEEFKKIHPRAQVIFNDVGGVLNDELKMVLKKFKGKNFYYIYTFSHIPERAQVLNHMKFFDEKNDVIESAAESFKKAYAWFEDLGMHDQLIFDPGFGFSKTFEQNWRLIDHYDLLDEKIKQFAPLNTTLIGISKKSFLKKALAPDKQDQIEALHLDCLKRIQKSSHGPLLFRVHDPKTAHFSL